jgi:transposase
MATLLKILNNLADIKSAGGVLHFASELRTGHKGPRVRQLIEAAGASLFYLPPYSPDFNPIENAFAKLKALLRKAAERTVEGLWTAIGELIDLFTPKECRNFFAAAGYDAN